MKTTKVSLIEQNSKMSSYLWSSP